MKKSLLSVTAIALGVTTLFGVTVAAASNASELAVKVNATDTSNVFSSGSYANSKITWTIANVGTIVQEKNTSSTAVSSSYVSAPRWYSGHKVTFTPASGIKFTGMAFVATTSGYATALKNSTWSTGAATASDTAVTWTGNSSDAFTVVLGAQARLTSLVITYGSTSSSATLSNIALSGQTTEYSVDDTFSFDGTCTATYSDDSTAAVAPTSVTTPDMTTVGTKEVTVTYTEGSVTKTASYNITVAAIEGVKFNLEVDSTSSASASQLTWRREPISMEFNKASSSTATNNYYPGTSGQSYKETRAYKNSQIVLTADEGYVFTSIVFTASKADYATACAANTWTNATAVANDTTVTVTPSENVDTVSAILGAVQGFTSIRVYFEEGTAVEPEKTISTIQTVYEAAIAKSTDEFTFVGTVFATAGNSFYLYENGYGMLVYNTAVTGIAIGKKVQVTSTVQNYSGLAETKVVSSAEVVEGEGETVTPVEFTSDTDFLASRHNILGSASGLTEFTQVTEASSSVSGKYTVKFGSTTITLSIDRFAYTAATGEKLAAALASNFESLDIVGAPIGTYGGQNQFTITSADQLVVNTRSVYVSSVTLDKSTLSFTAGDPSQTLTASVTMSDSSAYSGDIEWSTSDASVATVANGVVTPVNAGTATITAKAGNETATCAVTVAANESITYSQLAKYDFADYGTTNSYTSEFVATETSGKQTLKYGFEQSYVAGSGSDIVTGVTNTAKVYGGQTGYLGLGIKFGTSSINGTFTIATSSAVDKVVVETYSWTATDTLSVGGITKTPGIVYSSATEAKTLEYIFSSSKTSIDVAYAKRGFIKSITLYAVEDDTPVVPEGFAINVPSEVDYVSETPFSFYNVPDGVTQVYSYLTNDIDADHTSTNYPDDAIVNNDSSLTPSIMTTLEEGEVSFYVQAYYLDSLYQPVYATPVLVTVNYGLSNYVTDFELIRTDCNNGTNVAVDSLKSNWAYMEEYWGDLSTAEQKTFKNTAADATAATSTLANTVALYDLIVAKYSVNNFANRAVSAGAPVVRSFVESTTTTTAIVTVAAISSITLVGGLTLAKKRKED